MGMFEVLWVVLIALKIAGVGVMTSVSWWIVILWIVPVWIIIILLMAVFK